MSEWLTTGQMIDELKVGEVAENKNGFKVTKNRLGGIGLAKDPLDSVYANAAFIETKWIILPKFVSFEEAKKALREGKRVTSWTCDDYETPYATYQFKVTASQDITINEILYAKWTIEGE